MASLTAQDVIRDIGLEPECDRLRERVIHWVEHSDPDMRPMLRQQFEGSSKYFRPLAVFACHHAVSAQPLPDHVLVAAQAIELFHNVTLIVDDLVDRSATRRGKLTLQAQYGPLTAWMVAGYIDAGASDLLTGAMTDEWADMHGRHDETRARRGDDLSDRSDVHGAKDRAADSVFSTAGFDTRREWASINRAGPVRFDLRLLSELKKRLAVAECVQWTAARVVFCSRARSATCGCWVWPIGGTLHVKTRDRCSRSVPAWAPERKASAGWGACSACCITVATTSPMCVSSKGWAAAATKTSKRAS